MKVETRIVGVSHVEELKTSSLASHYGRLSYFVGFQLLLVISAVLKYSVWKILLILSLVTVVGIFLMWYFSENESTDE